MPVSQHLLWIVPWALLTVWVGSPRFLGAMGPARTRRTLDACFGPPEHRLHHNVDIGRPTGNLHLDHVVITRSGICVIDSLCVWGQVKGTDVQQAWKAHTALRSREFDNPVHANRLKIETLAQMLGLPMSRFQGLVVFNGRYLLAATVPPNVISVRQLVLRLRARAPEILTGEQIDRVDQKLRDAVQQSPSRRKVAKWKTLQILLLAGLLAACAWVFRVEIGNAYDEVQPRFAQPGTAAGSARSSSSAVQAPSEGPVLNCVYSADTDRCACRDARGEVVGTTTEQCRDLAERGSVLKQ